VPLHNACDGLMLTKPVSQRPIENVGQKVAADQGHSCSMSPARHTALELLLDDATVLLGAHIALHVAGQASWELSLIVLACRSSQLGVFLRAS
jgi:hypothetical protein